MRIERVPIAKINPAPYNPRVDLQPSDPEYVQLATSVARWDLVEPLVWNVRTGNLVGGHQRLKVIVARGDTEVDASVVDLPPDEEAALNIALNKLSGRWDDHKLANVLAGLDARSFDLSVTGFGAAELAKLSLALTPPAEPFTPAMPTLPSTTPVTQADVDASTTKRDAHFHRAPAPPALVACPKCGAEFGV